MNKRFLTTLACIAPLLLGLLWLPLVSKAASAEERTYTPTEVQGAFRAVFDHNDLSDLPALAKHLGIEMRLVHRNIDSQPVEAYDGVMTRNPTFIYASGLSYDIRLDKAENTTIVSLKFNFRGCPNLGEWKKDWGLKRQPVGMFHHGAGYYDQIESTAFDVGFSITYYSGDYNGGHCVGRLSQKFDRILTITPTANPQPISSTDLVRKLVGILVSGDLRDDKKIAHILQTQLQKHEASTHRSTSFSLLTLLEGLNNGSFSYYMEDSSWKSEAFDSPRQKLSERYVSLGFGVDAQLVCINLQDLKKELAGQAIKYEIKENENGYTAISVRANHLITLTVKTDTSCMIGVGFRQITDVEHSLNSPIVFTVPTQPSGVMKSQLSKEDAKKLELLIWHNKDVTLINVFIDAVYPETPKGLFKEKTIALADAIKDKLIDEGISNSIINISGIASNRIQQSLPTVTVIPFAKK
jgi:hypothetical protein